MHQVFAPPESDTLVVDQHERYERQVLIRRKDEPTLARRLASPVRLASAQLLVLVTPGAEAEPSLVDAIPNLLRSLPEFGDGIESVWLAVRGLANEPRLAGRLATELNVAVIAPDGGVTTVAGACVYAGRGVGGTGWYRFSVDAPPQFMGARFPLPEWESWLVDTPVAADRASVEPVPCGLLVRSAGAGPAEPTDVALGVGVDLRLPKIVVGEGERVPPPAAVSAILRGQPSDRVLVVPASTVAATHIWLVELAMLLGRDVVFSAGLQVGADTGAASTIVPDANGDPRFRPFATVLRQPPGPGDQEVLDIAPPPTGWVRSGGHSYRLRAGGSVVADVVPSGLVLRDAGDGKADATVTAPPFDPSAWTLTLGVDGQVLGLPVLIAAEHLLGALEPGQRRAARIRLAGRLDEQAAAALNQPGASPRARPQPTATVQPAPTPDPPQPARPVPPTARRSSAPPPIMTTSGAPVSTVSTVSSLPPIRADEPEPLLEERTPVAIAPEPQIAPELEPPQGAPVAPLVESVPRPAGPLRAIPDRPSTTAEQTRFTQAAGERFAEALATVNAALATWPSMRRDESAGAKADYAAVCLYFGQGDAGAIAVSGAVRDGRDEHLDGQVPCIASGLRRLPTHRRAVLRQGKIGSSIEHESAPGTLLTEPAFLTASMDLDVTTPDADLDVLIWPATARRTSELLLHRPLNEVVFVAGARFKALAVRTAEEVESEEIDGPVAPKVAALFRELAPGETPSDAGLDERDQFALAKLDGVLAGRRRGRLRLVEDPAAIARMTTPLVKWQDAPASGPAAAVAS